METWPMVEDRLLGIMISETSSNMIKLCALDVSTSFRTFPSKRNDIYRCLGAKPVCTALIIDFIGI